VPRDFDGASIALETALSLPTTRAVEVDLHCELSLLYSRAYDDIAGAEAFAFNAAKLNPQAVVRVLVLISLSLNLSLTPSRHTHPRTLASRPLAAAPAAAAR
tara:strand:+ start:684 stop:989 length:306 start_codon:yes stop_codon:yes gene_type:complete